MTPMVCQGFSCTYSSVARAVALVVSADLPFAMGRFCDAEGITNVVSLGLFLAWLPGCKLPARTAPDGPPPSLTLWRAGTPTRVDVASVDQYAAEVGDLTAAILDGTEPRVSLPFSRGSIGTLADLDRAARTNAGLVAG